MTYVRATIYVFLCSITSPTFCMILTSFRNAITCIVVFGIRAVSGFFCAVDVSQWRLGRTYGECSTCDNCPRAVPLCSIYTGPLTFTDYAASVASSVGNGGTLINPIDCTPPPPPCYPTNISLGEYYDCSTSAVKPCTHLPSPNTNGSDTLNWLSKANPPTAAGGCSYFWGVDAGKCPSRNGTCAQVTTR